MNTTTVSLSKADTLFMAACTGLIVANIYYCQPLIVLIARDFGLPENRAGSITYLTQIGYALGLFLLVPVGDIVERRKQILIATSLAIASLLAAAWSPSFLVLEVSSVLIGASSVVPQLILPLAAHLTPDQKRGSVIGTVMSGLLIGILASRSISGMVGALLGWREMYLIAAGISLMLLVVMRLRFPESKPSFKSSYGQLMGSLVYYFKTQPALRHAAVTNMLSFAVVSAFWVTMVLFLSGQPFNYSSVEIGLFGLAGATGALAAPLVGKISNANNTKTNILIGLVAELLSFAAFYFTGSGIFLLLAGIVLIDVGHQAVQITNQTLIYSLVPEARNRFNTVFMTATFIGGATGSALGLLWWKLDKWPLFCLGCACIVLVNIMLAYINRSKR